MRMTLLVMSSTAVLSSCSTDVVGVVDDPPDQPLPVAPVDDTGEAPVESDGPGCDQVLESSEPVDGAFDVFYRDDITLRVAVAPESATIVVTDADGTVVPGTTTLADVEVRWTGEPFAPNTRHDVTLQIPGCRDQGIDFLVTATGAPAGNVDGRVYDVDLTTGEWTEPPGIGLLASQIIPIDNLWISPSVPGDQISLVAAFVTPFGNQAPCLPTLPFPATTFEDPYFESSTPALPFDLQGSSITFLDATLSGAFAPNGGRIDELALTATMDVREVQPFVDDLGLDLQLCDVVAQLDRPCFACADAVEACVMVTIEDLDAILDATAMLVERTPQDVANDPICAGYP
ncbi:MAG: hypothetical protein AAF211_18805 [Myxococcota bacterium]